ncbi:MAG TPA: beta-glucosidase BglX [Candidatus Sulfomarinibacteraceae bacterium]|nr:beta-glucosidase BglX [Candidatus Sulfomarinibacteraceae bacterium]
MTHFDANRLDPDVEARIDQLLEQMTLAEQIGQMVQIHVHEGNMEESLARISRGDVGSVLNYYGAAKLNRLQREAVEGSRLGIPLLFGNDVIHGYRTIFPIPLALSCSWDEALVEEMARLAAVEATADGTSWTFAPMVDVARDPRWGRIAEGAGEDPFLGAALARAQVRGFQADDLPTGRRLLSCPKHFAAYGAAEGGKDYNTVDVSVRRLRDVYLPPFRAALDAGAGTVMSAFNEIAGVPCTANSFLLRTILRDEWGFDGFVLSDWDAVGELLPHGYAETLNEAARLAIWAGIDMDMASGAFAAHLAELVQEELVPEALVEAAARRVLRQKLLLGLFEAPYVDEERVEHFILTPAHREKALEAAQKSIVLLKNEGSVLPLDAGAQRVALIGPLADDHHEILGTWHRIGRDEDTESVLDGLRAAWPEAEIEHVRGCGLAGDEIPELDAALEAVARSEVVVLVLGEGEAMSGEAHSRAHLGLPGAQQRLLEAVHAAAQDEDKPLVVVLMSGRPLVVPWVAEHVPAIVQAWHGGIRAGRAVADVLLGAVSPSGKLTATWPRAVGQIPIYYAHKNTGRPASGPGVRQFDEAYRTRYIDEANEPLFPFGHGLSYTTFAYEDLQVATPRVALDGEVQVSALVRNTGERAGEEIVQLYVRDVVGQVTRPVRELKGFRRVRLAPGEQQRVHFTLPVSSLAFHGQAMTYRVEPGEFQVWIGPDSVSGVRGAFTVVGV